MSNDLDIPVYKVGLVLVRALESAEPYILLVRPHAKHAGETAPLVLPRGSRAYRTAQGNYEDVRDDEIAQREKYALEPLEKTLIREAEEEAGVPHSLLKRTGVYELGVRTYGSSDGVWRQIQWYVLPLDDAGLAQLQKSPSDAVELRWVSVANMEMLAASGEAREGYVQVVKEALALLKAGKLPKVAI